jgi:hypothetical protein
MINGLCIQRGVVNLEMVIPWIDYADADVAGIFGDNVIPTLDPGIF